VVVGVRSVARGDAPLSIRESESESGPLRAVHLSRHKWPGGLVNLDSGRRAREREDSVRLPCLQRVGRRARGWPPLHPLESGPRRANPS